MSKYIRFSYAGQCHFSLGQQVADESVGGPNNQLGKSLDLIWDIECLTMKNGTNINFAQSLHTFKMDDLYKAC